MLFLPEDLWDTEEGNKDMVQVVLGIMRCSMINLFVEHVITVRKRVILVETVLSKILEIIGNMVMYEITHLLILLRTIILFNLFMRKH
eukprot:Seg10405.1 transcript_id=Seg10405.1/GoldUCD/mRNA.D3Y31 product="hypothetical protein" protein_id=Seg10405.1/GoldUCD/D3Y31